MAFSIKAMLNIDDSKCAIKFQDVDEIRINEFHNGGPVIGIIHSEPSVEKMESVYQDIERILNVKLVRPSTT